MMVRVAQGLLNFVTREVEDTFVPVQPQVPVFGLDNTGDSGERIVRSAMHRNEVVAVKTLDAEFTAYPHVGIASRNGHDVANIEAIGYAKNPHRAPFDSRDPIVGVAKPQPAALIGGFDDWGVARQCLQAAIVEPLSVSEAEHTAKLLASASARHRDPDATGLVTHYCLHIGAAYLLRKFLRYQARALDVRERHRTCEPRGTIRVAITA